MTQPAEIQPKLNPHIAIDMRGYRDFGYLSSVLTEKGLDHIYLFENQTDKSIDIFSRKNNSSDWVELDPDFFLQFAGSLKQEHKKEIVDYLQKCLIPSSADNLTQQINHPQNPTLAEFFQKDIDLLKAQEKEKNQQRKEAAQNFAKRILKVIDFHTLQALPLPQKQLKPSEDIFYEPAYSQTLQFIYKADYQEFWYEGSSDPTALKDKVSLYQLKTNYRQAVRALDKLVYRNLSNIETLYKAQASANTAAEFIKKSLDHMALQIGIPLDTPINVVATPPVEMGHTNYTSSLQVSHCFFILTLNQTQRYFFSNSELSYQEYTKKDFYQTLNNHPTLQTFVENLKIQEEQLMLNYTLKKSDTALCPQDKRTLKI